MQLNLSPREIARFWSKVDTSGGPNACWPFRSAPTPRGYRALGLTQSDHAAGAPSWIKAHRAAFFLANGHWPEPETRHTCDNRACVNPRHLLEGTAAQNTADKVARGHQMAGEAHVHHKLTVVEVRAIRRDYQPGVCGPTVLAKRYGVSRRLIGMIVNGQIWAAHL
jgi:hypothetical protein